jgi:4-hydroxyphenylacetate 3-monooxygenase
VLATGQQKLERMRDGRAVYIGGERVEDVTVHPAFREGANTVARLYDLKADPAQRDEFSFEEDGERISLYWLRCRNRDDLVRRMRCCKAIADATYGFVGRSPDQVSGLVTGLAMRPELLDGLRQGFGQNLARYYDHARKQDLYLSFAVTPASGRKSPELFPNQQRDDPNLQVVAEDDAGVIVSGMKIMATGAVFADEILIGNLTPIDDRFKSEAITAALPLNAPGLSLLSRQP